MPATFQPPIVHDLPTILADTRGIQWRSWRHYGGNPAGVSVVRVNGMYTTVRTPTVLQLEAAGNREGTDFFLGGHVYVVTDEVAAELADAGYTPSGLTWGAWAATTWGEIAAAGDTWEST